MPFKTQYGSHYHMTYGCHGATIPCDTAGLTPCSDCCGGSGIGGGDGSRSLSGTTLAGGTGGGSEQGLGQDTGDFGEAGEAGSKEATRPSSIEDAIGDAVAQAGTRGATSGMSAPEAEIDPASVAGVLAGEGSGSDYDQLPRVSSIGKVGSRGRYEGMLNGSYVVIAKNYDGSSRVNKEFDLSPARLHDGRRVMKVQWEDNYWDKSDYFYVQMDGTTGPDAVGSYSSYAAEQGLGQMRHAGLSDEDIRRIVDAAAEAYHIK